MHVMAVTLESIARHISLVSLGLVAIPLVGLCVYVYFFYVDFAKIQGLPEIPGGNLLAGHLYDLGQDHADTLHKWSIKYDWPVFQARMGYRRAVILNSYETAQEWISKNHASTADRPWFHTFHGVVSATSAATIGSSPWNERTKKQRRIFGSYTTSASIKKLRPVMDLETYDTIKEMFVDSQRTDGLISPHIYMKRLALNSMMMFGYGSRFASSKDSLFRQIISDANIIASFRSSNANYQDFIPHLRYAMHNKRTDTALEVRTRRDGWLKTMFENIRQTIGIQELPIKPIAEMMLSDNQNGLTECKLLPEPIFSSGYADVKAVDFKTMLGGLLSGGFDTLFTNSTMGIGVLSSEQGQKIQQRAYDDLLTHYTTPEEAFEHAMDEERSPYVSAFVKEVLRLYPPLKMLPPRQTYAAFSYQGAHIPKGILIYMNSQAINRDPKTYAPDPDVFRPERWFKSSNDSNCNGSLPPTGPLYTFGAGARVCTGVNFASRILYAIYARMIICFQIQQSKSMPANIDYLDYNDAPTAASTNPKDFQITLVPRDPMILERCFAVSEKMTKSVVTIPVPKSG